MIDIINNAFENKDETGPEVRAAVNSIMASLDDGSLRVAQKKEGEWHVNEYIKKAILLSFRLNDNKLISGAPFGFNDLPNFWYDKVPSKFEGWDQARFKASQLRVVPGAIVRYGSHIGKNVILMPSFVNVGASIDDGTLIDTWATVGSCAQIGKNCHISGGAGIGGVLEPLQANPVIVEDNCFIGARSEIVEGVIVEEGAVISMGVYIGASTKIIDRATGEVHYGRVPAYSVVVPGSVKSKTGAEDISLYAAIIVKKVDKQTRDKTAINRLLRDYD